MENGKNLIETGAHKEMLPSKSLPSPIYNFLSLFCPLLLHLYWSLYL